MPAKIPKGKHSPKVKKSARKQQVKQASPKKTSAGKKKPSKKNDSLMDIQKQLNIVLDTASMGIWEWIVKEDKVTWAGKILEIFGTPKESFATSVDAYLKFVHPDDRELITSNIQQAFAGIKSYNIEYRIILGDGEVRWINAVANLDRDEKGEPVRMYGTLLDVTERKTIEQQREEWKRRFELISTSAGLVIYDYHIIPGSIVWSGNCFDVLGYNPEELGDVDRWIELIHEDDRDESLRKLDEAQRKLEFYDVCYRFAKKNGEYCFMHDRGMFIADKNGVAVRMLGMMNDVTEAIQAQERLKESEMRFRTLHKASFGGIGLHDRGMIIDCNEGLCDITGYSYDELIGSNGLNLIAPEWRDFVFDKIKTGYEQTYDVEGIRKDGTRYAVEIRGKNVPYEGKNIRVTEFRDVTERMRSEQMIKEQHTRLLAVTEDLKRKNAQLEEFTQIVSHNLRSPVGNIMVLVNFLETATTDAERKEYLNLLKDASAITHSMITELNEILKVKQNKNIEKQELNFESVLKQVRSMLSAKITSHSAEVTSDFSQAPAILYPSIYLDSIFLNLLDNSLKYHSPERKPKIHFKTTFNESGDLVLEVHDNGLGIDMERYGHHVFKLRKTFHMHPESRGIGLFMIKNQIEAMGGEITISSKQNEGSSFFINFSKHLTDAS
jgi:PAS domain S-box-containing protein